MRKNKRMGHYTDENLQVMREDILYKKEKYARGMRQAGLDGNREIFQALSLMSGHLPGELASIEKEIARRAAPKPVWWKRLLGLR